MHVGTQSTEKMVFINGNQLNVACMVLTVMIYVVLLACV